MSELHEPPPDADLHDATDIGSDVWIRFFTASGSEAHVGLIEEHRRSDNGEWCSGAVLFDTVPPEVRGTKADGTPRHVWHVDQAEPLTLSPSLLCSACGHHGFIRDGRWVPA